MARFRQQLDLGNIEAALAEWTGTPLAGLEAPGLTPAVDGLVEQWLATVEIDLERRLQTNPTAAIGPLTELTANHPFREGLWSLLMTALYRVGRQADALDAYQKARHHLVEQLGVEPGPRLRELESLILGQDEQLRGPERSTEQTSRSSHGDGHVRLLRGGRFLAVVGDAPEEDGCSGIPPRRARAGCGEPPRRVRLRHGR